MKKKINIKDVVLFLVIVFILNCLAYFAIKQYDAAFESRAKAAGYYEKMPDNLKNPNDIKK